MKKFILICSVAFTSLKAAAPPSEDLMIMNGLGTPLYLGITLHNRSTSYYPFMEYVEVTVPATGNVWFYNGQPGIPFSAIAAYTNPIHTIFSNNPFDYGPLFAPNLQNIYATKMKWNYIKSDLGSQHCVLGYEGHIKISPFYDSSLGSYSIADYPGAITLDNSDEVYLLEGSTPYLHYNQSFPAFDNETCSIATGESYHIFSSASPFGGYIVSITKT